MTITHPTTIGIQAADLATWLKPHPDDGPTLKLRADLIAQHRNNVLAFTPAAEAGLRELAAFLTERDGVFLPTEPEDILAALGGTYAEDICVLTPQAGQHILSAAILCFPNRWRLTDKAGKPILAVHAPVPDYADKLSSQVDFFLDRLRPGRCFTRDNWGLVSTPTLHLPDPVAPVNPMTDANFFMRREDQSFVKLPDSNAVIFTIRTTVTPWAELTAENRAVVLEQTKHLSRDWLRYKSMTA